MNILITSAGRRAYLIKYFKSVFNKKGKVYASNSEYSIALQAADEYLITPLIYEDDYVTSIINFCLKNDIKAIISVFDIDLLVLAKNKQLIESKGIKLLLSGEDVVKICNDKYETFKFLQQNGIGSPKTYISIDSVTKALDNKEIEFPIIIKPRWGMASMSIYIVNNLKELIVLSEKANHEIFNSYLKYESKLTKDKALIYQEVLKGQEYGIDIISNFSGDYVGVFPKSKLRMRSGETDLGETVPQEKFAPLAKKISNLLKHEVIMSVDCFDDNGELKVIEMNCRISGHYPLSHLAGVNLPQQIHDWLDGKETNIENFKFNLGLKITKDLIPTILIP